MKTETNRHIRTGCEKGSRHVTSRRHRWLPGLGRQAPQPRPAAARGARGACGEAPAGGLRALQPGGRAPEGSCWPWRPVSRYRPWCTCFCPSSVPRCPSRPGRGGGGLGAPRRLLFFWNPRCRQPRTSPRRGGVCPRGLAPELTRRAGEGGPRTGQPPAGCGPLAHLTCRKQTAGGAGQRGRGHRRPR